MSYEFVASLCNLINYQLIIFSSSYFSSFIFRFFTPKITERSKITYINPLAIHLSQFCRKRFKLNFQNKTDRQQNICLNFWKITQLIDRQWCYNCWKIHVQNICITKLWALIYYFLYLHSFLLTLFYFITVKFSMFFHV